MSSPVNLAAFAGDRPWSVLQSLVHWQRSEPGLRRVCLYAGLGDTRAGAGAAGLGRLLKEACPDLRVEVREGGLEPGSVRAHLEAWHRSDPTGAWILNLAGFPEAALWAAEPWIGRAGCRVLQPRSDGSWVELRRNEDGRVESQAVTELRRESTDALPLPALLRWFAVSSGPGPGSAPEFLDAEELPVLRLTEEAVRHDWRWSEAFAALGVATNDGSDEALFQRYLAAFLRALGATAAGRTTADGGLVWAFHGGRLLVLDARAAANPAAAEAPGLDFARLAETRRRWPGLPLEAVLLRPGARATEADRAVADALGLRVIDEADAAELPTHLARLIGLPLSSDGTEIERQLRHHLAASGKLRVFAAESALVAGQSGSGTDPVVADVGAWLLQIRTTRRQNWQAWKHGGRLHVRVPAGGASSPVDDWRLLLSAVLRLGPEEVTAEADGAAVLLSLADGTENRQRLGAWFRPFLNSQLTFVAARDRLAAEARAAQEALPPRAAPVRGSAPSPSPTPPSGRRPVSGPAPAAVPTPGKQAKPAAPAPAKRAAPAKFKQVSLEDLDRALDDALGG